MSHLKTQAKQKRFIRSVIKRSRNKKETRRIYRAVEKAIRYKKKWKKE